MKFKIDFEEELQKNKKVKISNNDNDDDNYISSNIPTPTNSSNSEEHEFEINRSEIELKNCNQKNKNKEIKVCDQNNKDKEMEVCDQNNKDKEMEVYNQNNKDKEMVVCDQNNKNKEMKIYNRMDLYDKINIENEEIVDFIECLYNKKEKCENLESLKNKLENLLENKSIRLTVDEMYEKYKKFNRKYKNTDIDFDITSDTDSDTDSETDSETDSDTDSETDSDTDFDITFNIEGITDVDCTKNIDIDYKKIIRPIIDVWELTSDQRKILMIFSIINGFFYTYKNDSFKEYEEIIKIIDEDSYCKLNYCLIYTPYRRYIKETSCDYNFNKCRYLFNYDDLIKVNTSMHYNLVVYNKDNIFFNTSQSLVDNLRVMIKSFVSLNYDEKNRELFNRFLKLQERFPVIEDFEY